MQLLTAPWQVRQEMLQASQLLVTELGTYVSVFGQEVLQVLFNARKKKVFTHERHITPVVHVLHGGMQALQVVGGAAL